MTDEAHLARLALQIERAVGVQNHLRELLDAAGSTVAGYRLDVRTLKARLARKRRGRRQRA
jgi:hypothetical protein